MPDFAHLHLHTQYSLLDGATRIENLIAKAQKDKMKAIAVTDHGNMFGIFKFVAEANKQNIIPIVGCEFYLAKDRLDKKNRDRYHQILLAKDEVGYKNISKLCSLGFLEGLYYKPRIDRELIKKHKEGVIATTCCLQGEVPRTILEKGEEAGEKIFLEWLDIFGEDYYIELQRHGIADQDKINEVLVKWSKKHHVKAIATNDVHYLDEKDSEAHDILLCIQTGKDLNDPKRLKFYNNKFFLKTKEEMAHLFNDLPEALDNTLDIVSKIKPLELKRDILLPNFILPEGFQSEDDYLKHLTYKGAQKRYKELTEDVRNRLDYELQMIKQMGFAGYFLIVQDFITVAKGLNVLVGPGRGSVAGSAVAYAIDITNIEPLKYNLLFERFLNPERISMPDIDIDFDDEGREKVINYVVDKYGKKQVAQIITFGTMASKMAIRDVARVTGVPLPDADKLAKLVPDGVNITFEKAYKQNPDLAAIKNKGPQNLKNTLQYAEILEGSVRHSGIHAAGIIISPDDLMEYIPVCKSNDSELYVTQFDGKHIEAAGMLKMDFLGLKTLSIIKDAIESIEKNHETKIDIDAIPFDDPKTFELYQQGKTMGTFQFESEGMRGYLKELKPTNIEDLIAMNALYRPGPMSFIPEFIKRKHGKKKVAYPHESLKSILENTYGIMVYQEQIMQIAQEMGGFTLGAADILRKAMGKKIVSVMQEQKQVFIEGAKKKNIEQKIAEEVFAMMEGFAEYGFNRSHSTAYSILAFQTVYLKANYPAEYMSSVLTHNMNDVKKIDLYLSECKHMGLDVLGPDLNESNAKFMVNQAEKIRFGLAAIKGVGEAAMEEMVTERNKNGPYSNIYDLTKRVNLRVVNKRCLEALALAGAFDCFENVHRAQYFHTNNGDMSTIEKATKFGSHYQAKITTDQNALFETDAYVEVKDPAIVETAPWSLLETLQKEKEVTGIYISGHPLDNYKLEVQNFCNCRATKVAQHLNKDITLGGIVTRVKQGIDKYGKRYGLFDVEDYSGKINLSLFSEAYLKMKHFLIEGEALYIKGRYQLRYKSTDRYEFRIKDIMLLADVKDKELKDVTINIPLSDISEELIAQLDKIITENPGKARVKFKIADTKEKLLITLPSKKAKLDFNDKVIRSLQKINLDNYKLN